MLTQKVTDFNKTDLTVSGRNPNLQARKTGQFDSSSSRCICGCTPPKQERDAMKVLVADDSGIMRKIIIRSLNAVGVTEIVEAANGQEAIDAYQANPCDLILTDWNMPVKTGLDVVTEIRASGSQVPIIMVTTEAQKGQVIAAIQAGVNDYLTKPFEADDLRAKLDKFVSV
jgi:two-component system chemotaxis response regulator CheY